MPERHPPYAGLLTLLQVRKMQALLQEMQLNIAAAIAGKLRFSNG
jgi:hypothetical protein